MILLDILHVYFNSKYENPKCNKTLMLSKL